VSKEAISLSKIKAPIAAEIEAFEDTFRQSMQSNVPLLDKIMHFIIKRKGKQMRPLFVFLSAKAAGGVTPATHHAAALIELLHTATLVHDDVVDNAYERRGFFSLNALWKNKIAVLVGDYLLSRGLLLAVDNKEFEMLRIVSEAVRKMSEGELLQMEKARGLNLDEEVYYEIIRSKTAVLIAACCAAGAASAGADEQAVEKMRLFGEHVGMAFQIKDDLFDYGLGSEIGKPTGIDIKEKKITLPLLHSLNHVHGATRRRMVNIIKNHPTDKKKVKELIDIVWETGGIKKAYEQMQFFTQKADQLLLDLPDKEAANALKMLVSYTVGREK
jgi:octaprenyl-diphosphate synthase